MPQLMGILYYLFPFEPSHGLIGFGVDILPWIYLICVILMVVMILRLEEKFFSLIFFIVPSAITSLIIPLCRVLSYFGGYKITTALFTFFFVIGPYLLLLCIISSLAGVIEKIFRKLSMSYLAIAIFALFCSFCFYILLVINLADVMSG